MCKIDLISRFDLLRLCLLLHSLITMIASDNHEDNHRVEMVVRAEHSHVRFTCDLIEVAWWKRPNLLATRYGIILGKYRSKMSLDKLDDGTSSSGIQLHVLTIRHLQSNDSGIYECETLGAIRQFNLTVTVRLTKVELGAQLLSSHDSSLAQQTSNQTDKDLLHQSSSSPHFLFNSLASNDGHVGRLREHQLIRLTCVVARALPAVHLHFPFDIDFRVEKNSTSENDDRTFRSLLVLILHIHRSFHRRLFHCEAIQSQLTNNENKQQATEQHRVLSNTLEMDVVYAPKCAHKTQSPPQFYTGLRRPINVTCFMHGANPSKLNFTWFLPNAQQRAGLYLNSTASYLTVLPNQLNEFGPITCRAQNELDLVGECRIDMIMGAVPDPIESCRYTYVNATLTVNCQAGFHQGDDEFFCYMHKRQENGSFSEHARLKGNCAFILPDLQPERHHDFRVFTKNKYGDNFDKSYSIAVGRPRAETLAEKTRFYWPYMTLLLIGTCLLSLFIICCCCHHIRRSMYNKRKSKGNFDSLTYQNNNNSHAHAHSNGKQSLVHLKQNGNGTAYPVRPYRSKDYLISAESSTLPRQNGPLRGIYSTDEDFVPPRRNTLKETDLDQLLGSSNKAGPSATATIKTLPLNRTRPLFSAFGPQNQVPLSSANTSLQHEDNSSIPFSMQRRSSFQTATKVNGFDFYKSQEPFYLIDRQLMRGNQRNHYSPERDLREREQYRERRREYSPHSKDEHLIDIHRENLIVSARSRENSVIVENQMLTKTEHLSTASSSNEQQWREMNGIDEIDYEDRYIDSNDQDRDDFKDGIRDDDKDQFNANDDRRSVDRVSIDYQRDNDTTFANYERDDDRYRDDGIFV